MNQQFLLEVIKGNKNGILASLIRLILFCLSFPYRTAVAIRNRRYDSGTGVQRVQARVISVGNLTTGGTGKTPLIAMLAQRLSKQSRISIVSRGYGAKDGQPNDEAMELEWLAGVPHVQNADRVAAANEAIRKSRSTCLLLDDGFQHRRLARDLDIVLIDATCPFGYDYLLPRGLLREPVASLNRADAIVLTRTDLVSESQLQAIKSTIRNKNSTAVVAETQTVARGLIDADHTRHDLSAINGPVFAFCGIGNPDGFIQTLQKNGVDVGQQKFYADHHSYSGNDLQEIQQLAADAGSDAIVCTLKDLVKINRQQLGGIPVFALAINIEFVHGGDDFFALVNSAIPVAADANATNVAQPDSDSTDANAA